MHSVSKYAKLIGASPSSVRARAARGSIRAKKVSGSWVILDGPRVKSREEPGRPISSASFDALADYLDSKSASLSPDGRRRARERAARLADRGVQEVDRLRIRSDVEHRWFSADPRALETIAKDSVIALSGPSSLISDVVSSIVEGYAGADSISSLMHRYGLREAGAETGNIHLRVVPRLPVVRRLHVVADLMDAGDSRSVKDAERILSETIR